MFGRPIYDHAVGDTGAVRKLAERKRRVIERYSGAAAYVETSHAFLKSWADMAIELFPRMSDAREVGHHGETQFVFEHRADLGCAIARGAAGAVGDGNEIGLHAFQRGCRPPQGLNPRLVLRREKFARAQWTLLREEFGDGPVGRHGCARRKGKWRGA